MASQAESDALRKTCDAIDQAIAALETELKRGVSVEREAEIRQQIEALKQEKINLGCDNQLDWDDLEIPPPSETVINETTEFMDKVANRIAEARDTEALIQVASDVLEKAGKLKSG